MRWGNRVVVVEVLLAYLELVLGGAVFSWLGEVCYVLGSRTITEVQILLNPSLASLFLNELILIYVIWNIKRLYSAIMSGWQLILKSYLSFMPLWYIWVTCNACCTQTIIKVLWTLFTTTNIVAWELILDRWNLVFCRIREITHHTICYVHRVVPDWQSIL